MAFANTKAVLEKLEQAIGDFVLGISTAPCSQDQRAARPLFNDAAPYQAKCYYLIWRYLRVAQMGSNDVFFDVGCGQGRMVCVAALFGVKQCIGIEISEALCTAARENARDLRLPHAPIRIIQGDASSADYSAGTVFAFFNPFGERTMEAVLFRIRESLAVRPRSLRIIYINPVAKSVLDGMPWLSLTAEKSFAGSPLTALYYRSNLVEANP